MIIYKVGNKILEYAMEEKKKKKFYFFHCVTLPRNKYAFHLLKSYKNVSIIVSRTWKKKEKRTENNIYVFYKTYRYSSCSTEKIATDQIIQQQWLTCMDAFNPSIFYLISLYLVSVLNQNSTNTE